MNRLTPTFVFAAITNMLALGLLSVLAPEWMTSPAGQNGCIDYLTLSILGVGALLLAPILVKRLRERNRQDLYLFVPLSIAIGLLGGTELGLFGSGYHVTEVSTTTFLVAYCAGCVLIFVVTRPGRTLRTDLPSQFLAAAAAFVILMKMLGIQTVNEVPHYFLAFLPRLLNLNAALALVFACVAMLYSRHQIRQVDIGLPDAADSRGHGPRSLRMAVTVAPQLDPESCDRHAIASDAEAAASHTLRIEQV